MVFPYIFGESGVTMLGVLKNKRTTGNLLNEGEIEAQYQSASGCKKYLLAMF